MSKKKLTLVVNARNAYDNKLYYGDEEIDTGQTGLRFTIDQSPANKRTAYLIRTNQVNVVFLQDDCPEEYQFDKIAAAFGDVSKIAKLSPRCEMIQISPRACDGCPRNPRR